MAVAGTFTQAQNERFKVALQQDSPYEFAVEEMRRQLEQGWRADDLAHQLTAGVGGGKSRAYRYEIMHGLFVVTEWHGRRCDWRIGMRRLITEAMHRFRGAPQQYALWPEEGSLWEEASA